MIEGDFVVVCPECSFPGSHEILFFEPVVIYRCGGYSCGFEWEEDETW